MRLVFVCLLSCFLLSTAPARAELGDVTLITDHPQYPGEGAFQTPEDCVRWATSGVEGDMQARALAAFNWLLTHQWHLHSPQEWNCPGRTPGARDDDSEMMVMDANRARFSYGYGLCGTVHAWNEVYWRALGLAARRRAFPGHTNSEVLLEGRWVMLDTDMAGVVFLPDGRLAGYDEIARDLSLLTRPQAPWPRYPFAWPSDFETMQRGWAEIARGGNWYRMYHGGYAAQPGVVHLRSGETFTRYFGPDAFGGPEQRRFWHQQPGGPNRLWTFANGGTPFHDGAQSNCRGRVSYGNAVFAYAPDLSSERSREGLASASPNLAITAQGFASKDRQPAVAVFEHFSPYVLCGNPADDADPMTGPATDGLVVTGQIVGTITVRVSADQGQSWSAPYELSGAAQLDVTDLVKGRYGWWLEVTLPPGSICQSLRMTTTCQLCQAIYPRLKPNGCEVTFRTGGGAAVPVLPRLEQESQTVGQFERRDLRSSNLEFVGRSAEQRLAYRVLGPKPASVVFRIPARTPLTGLSAAVRYSLRSPTPAGAEYALDFSSDGGKSWQPLGRNSPPVDNEFSSGWVYGAASLPTPAEDELLVRATLYGGGAATGLLAAELYGLRTTRADSRATVTYRWRERGEPREYAFPIPSGTTTVAARIPTGAEVQDDSVSIAVD